MVPRSMAYSTDRSRTSRTAPAGLAAAAVPSMSLPGALDTLPLDFPDRPQRRVADFVERVVEQRERGAQQDNAEAGNDDPLGQPGLERLVVLRPVQHRSPADLVRVAEADELEAGGEEDGVEGVGQEARHQQ